MKKCPVIIFALFLILFSCSVSLADDLASDANFKLRIMKTIPSLNYDQLIRLNEEVQKILFEKSIIDGIMIEPGTYEVGVDIPAGNYYFEGVLGRFPSSIHVYPSWDKMGSFDETQYIYNIGYGSSSDSVKSGKFALFDGNIVQIIQGPVTIHTFMGLF